MLIYVNYLVITHSLTGKTMNNYSGYMIISNDGETYQSIRGVVMWGTYYAAEKALIKQCGSKRAAADELKRWKIVSCFARPMTDEIIFEEN